MVFISISLIIGEVEYFFHMFVDHLYVIFGEMSIQVLCPFLSVFLSFSCGVVGILYIFWVLGPYQMYDLQIFSSIL